MGGVVYGGIVLQSGEEKHQKIRKYAEAGSSSKFLLANFLWCEVPTLEILPAKKLKFKISTVAKFPCSNV
jgi:hypothetical protein